MGEHVNGTKIALSLLEAEYKYFSDSFWKNEEAGERRFEFFIKAIGAVAAGVTYLLITGSGNDDLADEIRYVLAMVLLGALLAFGILLFVRILGRNRVTDELKVRLDLVRKKFADLSRELDGYRPFGAPLSTPSMPDRKFRLSKGGLAQMAAYANALVFAALVAVGLASPFGPNWRAWVVVLLAVYGVVVAVLLHCCFARGEYKEARLKLVKLQRGGR